MHVQDLVRRKYIEIAKIDGQENPADLGTKYLTFDRIKYLAQKIGLFINCKTKRETYEANTMYELNMIVID